MSAPSCPYELRGPRSDQRRRDRSLRRIFTADTSYHRDLLALATNLRADYPDAPLHGIMRQINSVTALGGAFFRPGP